MTLQQVVIQNLCHSHMLLFQGVEQLLFQGVEQVYEDPSVNFYTTFNKKNLSDENDLEKNQLLW